jgi:hypothetical protein
MIFFFQVGIKKARDEAKADLEKADADHSAPAGNTDQ